MGYDERRSLAFVEREAKTASCRISTDLLVREAAGRILYLDYSRARVSSIKHTHASNVNPCIQLLMNQSEWYERIELSKTLPRQELI